MMTKRPMSSDLHEAVETSDQNMQPYRDVIT